MINKKIGLSIQSGTRNKQQILKEFTRPDPTSSISSPNVIGTGSYGGNIPGCAGGIEPTAVTPCGDASSDLGVLVGTINGNELAFKKVINPDPVGSGPFLYSDFLAYRTGGSNITAGSTGATIDSVADGAGIYVGGYIVSAVPFNNVNDTHSVLWKFSFSNVGAQGDTQTQHAMVFTVRGQALEDGSTTQEGDDFRFNASHYLLRGVRIVWNETPSRSPANYIDIQRDASPGPVTAIPPGFITTGVQYRMWIISSPTSTTARLWSMDDPDTKYQVADNTATNVSFRPVLGVGLSHNLGFGIPDLSSTVTVHAVVHNPTDAAIGEECGGASTDAGTYMETLYRKDNYFRPEETDVAYYQQVYFDGAPVIKGTHYNIEDTYKIVPVDPEALSLECTALLVRQ